MIGDVRPYAQFEASLSAWISDGRTLAVNRGGREDVQSLSDDFITDWNPVLPLVAAIRNRHPEVILKNVYESVARLRMVKGPEEIEAMYHSERNSH